MSARYTKAERAEALEHLREILKPGDTVWTSLEHVSASGMTRWITPRIIRDDEPVNLTWWVGAALDYPRDSNHDGLKVGGCGMDMGFHLVYSLSRALFPDGFDCIGPVLYLSDYELADSQYEHIKHYNNPQTGLEQVHATPMEGAPGKLPAYLAWRHDCPSNDHSNGAMRYRHPDGGYALRHRWL